MEHLARRGGLSPPTRGNQEAEDKGAKLLRSIPAHAGEPYRLFAFHAGGEVYPRPRGGTSSGRNFDPFRKGLSPPTRGNPRRLDDVALPDRSIPAHAGEPRAVSPDGRAHAVYPRPRGGTTGSRSGESRAMGLSPPTRGNPAYGHRRRRHVRSIPAHAGEPSSRSSRKAASRVYPRPRGGTTSPDAVETIKAGLSPPTRGNRRRGGRNH